MDSKQEHKDAIEVSVIFHEGQRMMAVPKHPAPPAAQPAAQEFACSTGLCHYKAQRTWNGLTHDEYDAICDKHSAMSDFDFLADIEAKLKEKNQ
jgi:hypothetical protein